jgi:hypothetical protein
MEGQSQHADALIVTPEEEAIGIENLGSRAALLMALADPHTSALAMLFKFSGEAMWIRLRELGLLPQRLVRLVINLQSRAVLCSI